jgi:DNA-binding NtrC family response regulator
MHTFVCSRHLRLNIEQANYAVWQRIGIRHAVRYRQAGMAHHAEAPPEDTLLPAGAEGDGELPLKEACKQFERQYVIRVLDRRRWNISRAARVLRVHRNTILRKLSAWGLERPRGEGGTAC